MLLICQQTKNKKPSDGSQVTVDKVKVKEVGLYITERQCKKNKRKCLFSTVTVVKKMRGEPPAAAIPAAAADTSKQEQTVVPDNLCMDMFGDLGIFGPDGQQ